MNPERMRNGIDGEVSLNNPPRKSIISQEDNEIHQFQRHSGSLILQNLDANSAT
jgi:hypothetical protein